MSILLIRHGETAFNVARIFQPADTPLSERGLAQAQALAKRLAATPLRAIISSDLPRAVQTAQAIAQATGAPIEYTPLLQEKNFGDWRGQPYDGMGFDPMAMRDAPPGGESMSEFEDRVAKAFAHVGRRYAEIESQHQSESRHQSESHAGEVSPLNVAVVTHGLVLGAILSGHVHLPDTIVRPTHMDNTSISIIDARSPYPVQLINCTQHLAAETVADPKSLSGG